MAELYGKQFFSIDDIKLRLESLRKETGQSFQVKQLRPNRQNPTTAIFRCQYGRPPRSQANQLLHESKRRKKTKWLWHSCPCELKFRPNGPNQSWVLECINGDKPKEHTHPLIVGITSSKEIRDAIEIYRPQLTSMWKSGTSIDQMLEFLYRQDDDIVEFATRKDLANFTQRLRMDELAERTLI